MCLKPIDKFVNVCVPANTHTFFVKNRVDREIHSTDLCMSTTSLCLIAHHYLAILDVKIQV